MSCKDEEYDWRDEFLMKTKDYYMNLDYPIVLSEFKDEGESLFSASIVELPGLEVVGDSFEEVLEDIEDAKEIWLETALKLGKAINESNS